jgi:hypothetical protein
MKERSKERKKRAAKRRISNCPQRKEQLNRRLHESSAAADECPRPVVEERAPFSLASFRCLAFSGEGQSKEMRKEDGKKAAAMWIGSRVDFCLPLRILIRRRQDSHSMHTHKPSALPW